MIYLYLFFEFFKIGLFAVGGGLSQFMKAMGFEKLSEIPASRYQELLDKVRAAVEDK